MSCKTCATSRAILANRRAQLRGLTVSVRNVISHALKTGQVIASREKIASRIIICNACEHYLKAQGKCALCGCFLVVKTGLEAESCPARKW